MFYAIRLDHQRIGTLRIVSDKRHRGAMLRQYAVIAAGIVLVSLLIAFVLSSKLQRSISAPIVELARVAGLVSEHKNFGMRASNPGVYDSDEIGNLMTGFNSMLAEIESSLAVTIAVPQDTPPTFSAWHSWNASLTPRLPRNRSASFLQGVESAAL